VRRFEGEFLDYVAHNASGLFDTLAQAKSFDDELEAQLTKLIDDFKSQFQPTVDESGSDEG
jgi:F-type H+-transporting ATPase subunit alpha